MSRWYTLKQGKPHGPLEESSLIELIKLKKVGPWDLAFKDGARKWQNVSEYSEFSSLFPSPDPSQKKNQWVILKPKEPGSKNNFKQMGPYSTEAVEHMIQSGEVAYQDYAWRDGMQEWYRIANLEVFNPSKTEAIKFENKEEANLGVPPLPQDDDSGGVFFLDRSQKKTKTEVEMKPPEAVTEDLAEPEFLSNSISKKIKMSSSQAQFPLPEKSDSKITTAGTPLPEKLERRKTEDLSVEEVSREPQTDSRIIPERFTGKTDPKIKKEKKASTEKAEKKEVTPTPEESPKKTENLLEKIAAAKEAAKAAAKEAREAKANVVKTPPPQPQTNPQIKLEQTASGIHTVKTGRPRKRKQTTVQKITMYAILGLSVLVIGLVFWQGYRQHLQIQQEQAAIAPVGRSPIQAPGTPVGQQTGVVAPTGGPGALAPGANVPQQQPAIPAGPPRLAVDLTGGSKKPVLDIKVEGGAAPQVVIVTLEAAANEVVGVPSFFQRLTFRNKPIVNLNMAAMDLPTGHYNVDVSFNDLKVKKDFVYSNSTRSLASLLNTSRKQKMISHHAEKQMLYRVSSGLLGVAEDAVRDNAQKRSLYLRQLQGIRHSYLTLMGSKSVNKFYPQIWQQLYQNREKMRALFQGGAGDEMTRLQEVTRELRKLKNDIRSLSLYG